MAQQNVEYEMGVTDKVFFLHIPKTAGITLRIYLESRFHPDAIFKPHQFDEPMLATSVSSFNQYQLFRGHFPYDAIRQMLDRPPVCLTMLRNPVERFVSNYAFWQQEHRELLAWFAREEVDGFRHLSLGDLVQATHLRIHRELQNVQTRFFGERFELTRSGPGFKAAKTGAADIDLAKSVLGTFAAIGLTERFQESLCVMAYTFGWPPPATLAPKNVTRRRPRLEQLSPETLSQIENMNQLDLEFYAYGQQWFEGRLAAVTEALLQRYGSRAEAHLGYPLPIATLTALLEKHYRWRYAERRRAPIAQVLVQAGDPVFNANWHVVEHNAQHGYYRWSGPGTFSSLDLPLADHHDLEIQIRVLRVLAPEVLRGVQLRVNNLPVLLQSRNDKDGATLLVGRITQQALRTQRPFSRLELEVSQTISPQSLDAGSPDPRRLGLAIHWLKLTPVSEMPAGW